MDAVGLLNDVVDPLLVMQHYDFDSITTNGDMIRSACKLHGGNNGSAFVMNLESGLWYCHTGDCGGGDIYTLVQKLEGCSFSDAVQRIAEIHSTDVSDLELKKRNKEEVEEARKWLSVMNANVYQSKPEYELTDELSYVNKFRNFKESTLSFFELFFAESVSVNRKDGTPYKMFNRLIIPIRENGKLVGVSMRATRSGDEPKWLHAPRGLKTRSMLYNYDNVIGKPLVAVVEGIFDVWAFHEIGVPAVATYGAHLTDTQYKMLLMTGADILIAYDEDEAGRKAKRNAIKALQSKANLYAIQLEEGDDPSSVEREELKQKYESRVRV